MQEFRKSLPSYKERDALLEAISQNQVCASMMRLLVLMEFAIIYM